MVDILLTLLLLAGYLVGSFGLVLGLVALLRGCAATEAPLDHPWAPRPPLY